ncbi:GIY-YIG nuclease family protein [Pedobacter arcticus]|uniref:GIY-YIG nuclease family protein n=1 Tax=Pedobacter arcticus TaxID=752140 RepID=UPI00035F1895|nr:GIY-YIG nuclease family protein [Pedobacter arcticus]
MERGGCIYILTNKNKTTLYVGVTSDLSKRLNEHKNHIYPRSFSARYNLTYCIYYETFTSIVEAIAREKEIKKWRREKKEKLINQLNPKWDDLSIGIQEW